LQLIRRLFHILPSAVLQGLQGGITMAWKDKIVVRLTMEERSELEALVSKGKHSAATLTRARVLLKADTALGDGWSDERIAEALECGESTVARTRKRLAQGGLKAALSRKRPEGRLYRKLDGKAEARLLALACSQPPEGRARWTLRLLADKLVELEVVDAIDPATVHRTLKKTRSSRG
jgi:transposase